MSSVFFPVVQGLAGLLHGVGSSPFLSGPALLALTYAPDDVRNVILNLAGRMPNLQVAPSDIDFSTATTVLRVLFALGVVSRLNRAFNTMAANSWRLTASKGWDWPNEIAVVTGGSSGIGKLIVEKLAALGVRVAVLDLQNIPEEMQKNDRIQFFKCDVTSSESVAKAAEAIRQEIGHPSILVNNAGITSIFPILKIPESLLRKAFGVNTISHWFTAQQFLPHMIQANKGHIVTVASIASFVALPTSAHYSASKASALSFHESLTCELKHCHKAPNVLTTVVHPNFVRTPLIKDFVGHLERSNLTMLTPDDVATPIVEQIKRRRGGPLIVPSWASPIAGIKAWPIWIQTVLQDGVGRMSSNLAH
ncbi:hypothetical protein O1611_g9385 [Lasiodiplodia mahajangana]|uniref:Uncharacterized protein n=1 Tax=Lasiodiplodia mahajangana TaxID=1108764 RepID=A0ACC2JA17_9PEZI|nr:hypothetical protein O1611_g9385 [Lasiodiplodia mahajangana]